MSYSATERGQVLEERNASAAALCESGFEVGLGLSTPRLHLVQHGLEATSQLNDIIVHVGPPVPAHTRAPILPDSKNRRTGRGGAWLTVGHVLAHRATSVSVAASTSASIHATRHR